MKHKLFLIIVLLFSFYNCFTQVNDTVSTARLNNYLDRVLIVFYKCSLQDDEITKAIKAKSANDIEAARITLLQYANEGMQKINAIEDFDGDPSLKFSCRETLNFYKQLAEWDIPQLRDFFILEENFLKIKKEFEKKPAKKYSQSEIYAYNSEVKKYNAAVTLYTQLSNFINGSRKLTLYNWNASEKIFADAHRPHL